VGDGPELRIDRLTRTPTVIIGGRQQRPNRPTGCPFCPGGLEAPEPYETRWFPNRWPPLPDERAEVLLYSPQHGVAMWQLGADGVRRVVDLWADRTLALGARDDASYVLLFENRGAEVGATIDHPHGQVYAFADVPPVPLRELTAHACALCAPVPSRFAVSRRGGWHAWCPEASAHPYELRVAPDAHVQSLAQLDDAGRDELAALLVDALARLDQLFDAPMPYMLFWHQRPTDDGDWPLAHVHCHVAPYFRAPGVGRYVAAGEVGSGVYFNPVPPEDAAAKLRSLAGA
jgi:UDPglucose--hexose-1-phosphate uridylyltransferase